MTKDVPEFNHDSLSPTVTKVLSEYHVALGADEALNNGSADRLNALLQKGKVPKLDDIDAALFPPTLEGSS